MQLAVTSNNLEAMAGDLDFVRAALLASQQLEDGTSGLSLFLARAVSGGRIDASIASALQSTLVRAEQAVAGSRFDEAEGALGEFLSLVSTKRGTAIPPDLADDLALFANAIRELLFPNQLTPKVMQVGRFGFHTQPTHIAMTFNESLNPITVQDIDNYRIIAHGPDGRFGTRDDRTIRVKSAAYDATTNTVTLIPAQRLDLHRRYELIVNGSTPTGVADVARNLLDGAGSGKPGSNYVVILRGFGRDEPGRPFRKLIRDQLGGKPMSSRRVSLRQSSRVSHQTYAGPAHSAPQHSLRDERTSMPHGPLSSRRMRRGR
jgi:hypothetical protein